MKRIKFLLAALFAASFIFAQEQDSLSWPREVVSGKYTTTLYEPQYDSFEQNKLEGRMAFSIQENDELPLFGALWFKALLNSNKDTRIVTQESFDILKIHFPDAKDSSSIDKFKTYLENEIEAWDIEVSLDQFIANMKSLDLNHKQGEKLNNKPPTIIYRETPTILVSIDGEPRYKEDKESNITYVMNTVFFIARETKNTTYYLKGGESWYSSEDVLGSWTLVKNPPNSIRKFAEKYEDKDQSEGEKEEVDVEEVNGPPSIVVSTKPAELIVISGKPNYKPVEGTELSFVENTEEDIVVHINSQDHYTLIAGRWYKTKDISSGDWTFTEPSELPIEFQKIPEDSEIGNVRSSIPGTDEAQEALLEQSIPQTASVNRNKTIEVKYDGEPQFEIIEGTEMKYAINTDKSVLLINGTYYCVDDAVWYVSKSSKGPWKVSTERPDEVDEIPAESSVYNVKYVYVYDNTPDVVYVGYLPGYHYSYAYGGVVVYGTGYYYTPWYGSYYYPRPVTYGFGVHYNPWTGWGFHVGFSYGWIGWGFHPYHRSYWGPRGYCGGYRHGYHHGYHHGYRAGARAGYRAAQYQNRNNVYRNQRGVNTKNTRPSNRPSNPSSQVRPSQRPNNVYSDKNGNVYSRDKNGNWSNPGSNPSTRPSNPNSRPSNPSTQPSTRPTNPSTRPSNPNSKPSTRPSNPSTQPSTRPSQPSSRPSQTQQLDRAHQNRSRGSQNYNNYRSSSPSRSGGGGMRRR